MLESEPCRATDRRDCSRIKATFCSNKFTNLWKSSRSSDLWKLALLINQREQVTGFHSQEVQDLLIVVESDDGPGDAFPLVLLLFLLEDVTHEELLQLLVGKVNEQLLEAARQRETSAQF